MNVNLRQRMVQNWRSDFFSPRGFLARALVISAFFLAVHLAGLRDYTSVLNGTVGSASAGWKTSAFFGLCPLGSRADSRRGDSDGLASPSASGLISTQPGGYFLRRPNFLQTLPGPDDGGARPMHQNFGRQRARVVI